ncbi:cytochrome-c3 hydrogenase subunit gamma [Thermococcus chitonophagus]|uniref:Cytochrome-c3 hydrogenase subunit gamma n=1 Tax=Thermococcus chitonophagus TaxID=54262 RepID=A0A160VRY1_9EURY|nr:NAD(P)-dependent hydrogenase/sulfhydrogenase 2 subunit gamma [Thermococcus chitonophagus]ASJ17122.1 cytochrome-c3 hydrogenase subunit gamma [Thermococcus chitonophagus]CUX77727.1 Sulfhydrogenase II subunit g [Thermococcus chitonophagus]
MNPYQSYDAKIIEIRELTSREKLFTLRFTDREVEEGFTFKPGQFVIVDLRGYGEFPISLCSPPTRKPIQLCIRRAGRLTRFIHKFGEGDSVGIRGPYGNGFPLEKMEGANLILVAGGLGMAPLRSVLWYAIDTGKFEKIYLFYGTKSYEDILFRDEIIYLLKHGEKLNCHVKLAYEVETPSCIYLEKGFSEKVCKGVVTDLFRGEEFDVNNSYALICGPPVMYKFVIRELLDRGLSPGRIYMTLERRMKCGIGKCGHCVVGTSVSMKYICKDGPVFTYWDALSTRGLI